MSFPWLIVNPFIQVIDSGAHNRTVDDRVLLLP